MKKFFLFLLLMINALYAERVDIVSSFTLDELVPRNKMAKDTGFKVRYFRQTFDIYFNNFYRPDIDKVLIMADIGDGVGLAQVPLEKRVLLLWEAPGGYIGDFEKSFSKIYTFNDDVVDGKKYFKFCYPVLIPMMSDLPSFEEKKFCVMMTHRYTDERARIIRLFENKPFEEFEYYGFNPIVETSRYRGQIPGHPSGKEKLDILKNFRFCACFENCMVNGYITEKIFTCFTAGCVPIYWGAPNVEEYIPKDCFIDYRDFSNDEDLYQFLKSMSKERYNQYLQRIEAYLKSDKAHLFSPEHFNEIVFDCLKN